MHSNNLKIIFVAFNENSLGRRIINLMLEEGIKPVKVFMASELALSNFRKNSIRRYLKQNGLVNTIWRIYYRLTLRKELKQVSLNKEEKLKKSIKEICSEHQIPFGNFDNINHSDFVEMLKSLSPDLIVLGGAPLIKSQVINLPKIAVLNSHPAILPQAKGMDVVAQSILDNIPLGATVFKVDEGMDTGPVLVKKFLNFDIKGLKLYQIEAMVEEISAVAMMEAIDTISNGSYHFTPQEGEGKIYKSLGHSTYSKVKSKLKNL